MPASTVPEAPAVGGGSRARARSPGHARVRTGPDHSLLAFVQFAFVKHLRVNDPHQSSNDICADAVDAEEDINIHHEPICVWML